MTNGQLKLKKANSQRLRELGLGEAWLQDQIQQDPSLLGLGDLTVIKKEKIQPSGGRIDFVLSDPTEETRFEVELMLGAVNESHIIRTIEYWDIERQRYPTIDHRAVIVAEQITSRFFNVIRLLNWAIPIIAIQLSAFKFGDEVVLQFIRVLDTYELGAEPDDEVSEAQVDRAFWEKKATTASLGVVEDLIALVPTANGSPKITYNKHHIALGTSGYNFCWFHPRRVAQYCHMVIKIGPEVRQEILDNLEAEGIEAENQGSSSIRLTLSKDEIREHHSVVEKVIQTA